MSACPGCGLANYEGLCPHCRGDQDAYERELVPPFPSSRSDDDYDPPQRCEECGGRTTYGQRNACLGCGGRGWA